LRDVMLGMASCAHRRAERARTIQGLARLGFATPVVNQADCNPGSFERHTQQNATLLEDAVAAGKHLLSVEDDIDAKPELVDWVKVAKRENVIVTFTTIYPRFEEHIPNWDAAQPGLHALPTDLVFMGAQCVFFPKRVLASLAAFCRASTRGWDSTIDDWAKAQGERIFVAFPNPVQHRDLPQTFKRKVPKVLPVRKSRSFALEPQGSITEVTA